MKTIASIVLVAMLGLAVRAGAVTLVEEGKPKAEIVLAADASPSIRTAASELQRHLEKISGARLPIVNAPTEGVAGRVFVGESEFTKAKGFTLDDVRYDGFKIEAKDDYVILAGRQFYKAPLFGKYMADTRTEDWQKLVGRKWRFPGQGNDFRSFNKKLDFFVFDGTGTLYAVYEFLENLGMRWFLPMVDLGIVYPELETIKIAEQSRKVEPQFPFREFEPVNTKFQDEWLWYKSMKMGSAIQLSNEHSLGHILKHPEANPPGHYGKVRGKIDYYVPKMSSPELRKDLVYFLETSKKEMPLLENVSITPPDGWGEMDDEDAAAGWLRMDRGRKGSFSDYTWDLIADVREQMMQKFPDLKYTIYAYINNKLPPTTIDKIPENIIVTFCQTTSQQMVPESQGDFKLREEWLAKMQNDQMLVYDYYYEHAPGRGFPPVPVIFTKLMEENFRGMYGRVGLGMFVCIPWDYDSPTAVLRRPGLTHLMMYLHNKFLWNRDLDMAAVLEDYYEKFYGPARAEMKEFFEFAESVWMRPGPREISAAGGFLKQEDVDRYFSILDRAKAKAGDTIYGRRIDLLLEEMAPLRHLFENLKRTGAMYNGYRTKAPFVADGDLSKPFWTERQDTFYELKDINTGETPTHVMTKTAFRWMPDDSKLVIAVECMEPKMGSLQANQLPRDAREIFRGDFVEIRLETPQGIRPHIAVNPEGAILDESPTANAADLPHFYTIEQFAVKKMPDRWTAEIVIDAKKIGAEMPTKTYPWGIGVNRQRKAGNTPELYMLSPSGSDFQDLRSLGNLMIR